MGVHRRRGRRFGRGVRIVLLLLALGGLIYWFWWLPSREPATPLRIEFRSLGSSGHAP
ncbi:hypothetical protein HRbin15_01100 [bacterium HR15]|nr:hypothetical protein HRbin15_01100 [bacterium HR15]